MRIRYSPCLPAFQIDMLTNSYQKVYLLPRRTTSTPKSHSGNAESPGYVAQYLVDRAPFPTHHERWGRRPHAHWDTENLFLEEEKSICPPNGTPTSPRGRPIVLFSYVATHFDYSNQTSKGRPRKRPGAPVRDEVGTFRIVALWSKDKVGLIWHPVGDKKGFFRAEERKVIRIRPRTWWIEYFHFKQARSPKAESVGSRVFICLGVPELNTLLPFICQYFGAELFPFFGSKRCH
ncbi:hypothetical protein ASPVEDRAFT_314468 [Aspergillus versicolor CBS 583.65]|uniref:Uncharacterized protein n=1 Tax=Aspergillus versicolor CBS 583.65 TaxID=1036611 RepID=A0A1L9PX97_ASPVE|nr:uncharacterized protein ASPVEDRAFT_314468 [Aspergillus versicolor CBS 583.65]OJJ06170.1 hypothetical protein ASPVEDRAFT_314468 [Aspergillus versicolor CBS 583.65]